MAHKTKPCSEDEISKKYQKKDLHEHILIRPDTYIDSVTAKQCDMWVYKEESNEGAEIVFKEINYVPGFYKICDEILVNAADHTVRASNCNIIKVNIDATKNQITVWNNGDGIDVVEHPEHQIFVPELIFGSLLSGTNYDDNEEKIVGGRNGYGSKLTNIYSKKFIVETVDYTRKLKYRQRFYDNMYGKDQPKISKCNSKPYTCISFVPDLERFGLKEIDSQMVSLLKKRVYDLAMTTKAKVYYNDQLIQSNNFTKYVDLYFPEGSEHKKVLDVSNERWQVCAVYDPTCQLEHQNISFVNSICTSRGGSHVDHVLNQIVKKLKEAAMKRIKGINIIPHMIKENLIFFVNSIIVNPSFDTQTKEYLKLPPSSFGSKYQVTDAYVNRIIKTGALNHIISNLKARAEAMILKSMKSEEKLDNLHKHYPADNWGKKNGYKASLILTEGDSAKTFALSGLNVVGRTNYGVFPLKGKLKNVRELNPQKLSKNKEIRAIIKLIGLEIGKEYESLQGLSYGSVIVLTDQDVDGFHIKGLIMNFIHFFWPSLVKYEGFIRSFATPLLKATKGTGKKAEVMEFTNIQSFEEWKKDHQDGKGWNIKYYKGLGTSNSKEAQSCFSKIDHLICSYYWLTSNENKTIIKDRKKLGLIVKHRDACDDAITLAFDKNRADDRKSWINHFDPEDYLDPSNQRISYYDFVHKELITYSVESNIRSIPNLMDGFKPSQRKVFYGSILENIYKKEIRVSDLCGIISTKTEYHHGEKSLVETIINMAQKFVGSNNINLLLPNGQFGSRLVGGKDNASARYINTQLNKLTKSLFISDDFYILNHQVSENKQIEPEFYVPTLPMVLVNGALGIGTGYSTNIKPCNPRNIVSNIKRMMVGGKPKTLRPWYRHFTGSIEKIDHQRFICCAKYEIIDDSIVHITDLPIGVWTDEYKLFLENLIEEGVAEKKANQIAKKKANKEAKAKKQQKGGRGSKRGKTDYLAKKIQKSATSKVAKSNPVASAIISTKEKCTDVRVDFQITFDPEKLKRLQKKGLLEKGLKLVVPLNLTNMHLYDEKRQLKKYESYAEILENFYNVKLEFTQKRKDYLLGIWKNEMDILQWKVKFILGVISGEIVVFENKKSKSKAEVISQLENLKFPKFIFNNESIASYNYLIKIQLLDLTKEEVDRLKKMLKDKIEEIATLESKTPLDIWSEELDLFMEKYDIWEAEEAESYKNLLCDIKQPKRKRANP